MIERRSHIARRLTAQPGRRLLLASLLAFVCISLAQAEGFEPYRDGYALFGTGKYAPAASTWTELGDALMSRYPGSTETMRRSALAYVLATIAWERANNARAYQTWGLATQFYLVGSTRWETEREAIQAEYDRLLNELGSSDRSSESTIITKDDLFLMEMVRGSSLTSFDGPAPGLLNHEKDSTAITAAREYFPRRLGPDPDRKDRGAGKSKYSLMDGVRGDDSLGMTETVTPEVEILPYRRGMYRLVEEESVVESTTIEVGRDLVYDAQPPSGADNEPLCHKPPIPEQSPDIESTLEEASSSLAYLQGVKTDSYSFQKEPVMVALTDEDLRIARTAWKYFEADYQPNTGLTTSARGYDYATMWDIGTTLASYVAAEQLELISRQKFHGRIRRFLATLEDLSLYNYELPNREYNTRTGKSGRGSGWSAIDIGRLLIWLKIVDVWYPEYSEQVHRIIDDWMFQRAVVNREMNGVWFDEHTERLRQEGRLGYEQYSAIGYALWGMYLPKSFAYEHVDTVTIDGISIPYDTRELAFLTSEPFFLARMELGSIDPGFDTLTARIYEVQQTRWNKEKVLTAISEDAISRPPWFVYNNIYFDGKPWECVDHQGSPSPENRNVSTKTCFAWSVIFPGPYSEKLKQNAIKAVDDSLGYFAGIFDTGDYNRSLNVNTNGVILESMLYLKRNRTPFIQLKRGWKDGFEQGDKESTADDELQPQQPDTSTDVDEYKRVSKSQAESLAQPPAKGKTKRVIWGALMSSFSLPFHELWEKEHDSELRNLLSRFSIRLAYSCPLEESSPVSGLGVGTQGERRRRMTLSASVRYNPISYWMVSVTFYKYLHPQLQAPWNPDFSYTFGYDDWHPYTFSLLYSNYGGNRLSPDKREKEKFTVFEEGTFTLGWKFPSPGIVKRLMLVLPRGEIGHSISFNLTPRYMNLSTLTRKKWQKTVSFGTKYSIYKNWYFSITLYHYFDKDSKQPWNFDFSYRFGYFDWRPGKISVEYSNYSGSRFPWNYRHPGTGRFKDGSITVSWGWAF